MNIYVYYDSLYVLGRSGEKPVQISENLIILHMGILSGSSTTERRFHVSAHAAVTSFYSLLACSGVSYHSENLASI